MGEEEHGRLGRGEVTGNGGIYDLQESINYQIITLYDCIPD